jgi:hypothetical protein
MTPLRNVDADISRFRHRVTAASVARDEQVRGAPWRPGSSQPALPGPALAGVLGVLTGWRYVIRSRDPSVLPLPFLAAGGVLCLLVALQVNLGNQLIWIYGLHTVPVVQAVREGLV